MTTKLLYAAEDWTKAYTAFETINFTAYDFDTVKQSLLDYIKLKYPENFNDYIESSQLVALIELFAYVAEQLAYRVDMATHENLLSTAARKQSVLRLVRLISYSAARNMPLRGLVKLDAINVSEGFVDSQGNDLSNKTINYADSTNPLWREQFTLALNRLLTRPVGDPTKSFQSASTLFQLYEMANLTEAQAEGTSFTNGVLKTQVSLNGQGLPFELVPADIDEGGVFERSPDPYRPFSFVYSNDGFGDTSPLTGFHMYLKQGTLNRYTYVFDTAIPNRTLELTVKNVNDIDVWLQEVDASGAVVEDWSEVANINGDNIAFNTLDGYKKYEIETLEDDQIRIIFGAGDFSDIPTGIFRVWARTSESGGVNLPTSKLQKQTVTFSYMSKQGQRESCTLTYSLAIPLQNSVEAENIEHIRSVAPGVYQAQNRMVNGEDYNTFPLQDPSIIHLRTINRTFAGQPKYIEWNDASGAYQNIKLFGDDARLYYNISSRAQTAKLSARALIDEVIEPLLATPGVYGLLSYAFFSSPYPFSAATVRPRTRFIEDAGLSLQEKTMIQAVLDSHWYGEPELRVLLGPDLTTATTPQEYYGVVDNDTDGRVYDANMKTITGLPGSYTATPFPGGVSGIQGIARQARFGIRFNPDRAFASNLVINSASVVAVTSPDALTFADIQLPHGEETLTIEFIDTTGLFTVWGSVSGDCGTGIVGETYSNDFISFIIDAPSPLDNTPMPGDAFIIKLESIGGNLTPTIYKKNLLGKFELIDELSLPPGAETSVYNVADAAANWVIIVERVDDVDGKLLYWKVTNRSFDLTVESATTKFWYDSNGYLVDTDTKQRVRDKLRILKSNLNLDKTAPLGADQTYYVVDRVLHATGEVNTNALLISPDALTADNVSSSTGDVTAPFQFLQFIGTSEYIYFKKDPLTGVLKPVTTTPFVENIEYINNESSEGYVRKIGRGALDFLWVHYVPNDNVVDPSPSNINDMFILTKGYWTAVRDWLDGLTNDEPIQPSSYELRSTYRTLLSSKMISDTVVLHPAKVKLLFGDKAVPELRAKIKLVRKPTSRLTDDQLKIKVLALVNAYFAIEDWPLGQEFYATELIGVLHAKLPVDLQSAVLVPEFPLNTFGDMFYVRASADECLVSALTLNDILVVKGLDKVILKQSV